MNQPLRIDLQKLSDQQPQRPERTADGPRETEERSEFWASDFAASGVGKGDGGGDGALVP